MDLKMLALVCPDHSEKEGSICKFVSMFCLLLLSYVYTYCTILLALDSEC